MDEALGLLDRGEARLAEPGPDGAGRSTAGCSRRSCCTSASQRMEVIEHGPFTYHDKIPLKGIDACRACASCRRPPSGAGAFVEAGAILMPSYVNIGARVGSGTMVDTWATVGSGAQVGRDVHVAGGVGIGGVLEPPGARPVIIEDGAFLGSRCIVTEGVHRRARGRDRRRAWRCPSSVPVIDVTGAEAVEYRGRVPARAIVVPGTRPKEFPAGTYRSPCALVIGHRTESTDRKTSLNAALRDHRHRRLARSGRRRLRGARRDAARSTATRSCIAGLVEARCRELGVVHERRGNASSPARAATATRVALVGHLDTVPNWPTAARSRRGRPHRRARHGRHEGRRGRDAAAAGALRRSPAAASSHVFYDREEGAEPPERHPRACWPTGAARRTRRSRVVLEPTGNTVHAGAVGTMNADVVYRGRSRTARGRGRA